MNLKRIIHLGCIAACVFAASTATAQMRGHGGSMGGMGMRGGFTPHSMGGMPMHGGPMMNRFGNGNFNGVNRFGRFNRFNDGRFVRNNRFNRFNRFHHFNHFNNVVFIGEFGFPWWWGWGPWWGPGLGYPGYPYGYYGGYNYGGYGSGYGYGGGAGSRVAEVQQRLARAGYYHGAIDGIMGPATRRAIRAYERHGGYRS